VETCSESAGLAASAAKALNARTNAAAIRGGMTPAL